MGMFTSRSAITVLGPDYRFIEAYGPKHVSKFLPVGRSMTQQEHKDDCDVNTILKRFQLTGELGRDSGPGQYLDCTVPGYDFQTAQNFIADAHSMFMELPSSIRERFGNDPGSLIAFMEDPRNAQEAISLGLVRPPMETPDPVPFGSVSDGAASQPATTSHTTAS